MDNKYLEDTLIRIEVTESATDYLDAKDLKRDIDLLDKLLSKPESVEKLIVSAIHVNE